MTLTGRHRGARRRPGGRCRHGATAAAAALTAALEAGAGAGATAARPLVPYAAWCLFATVLNTSIVRRDA
ncbi:tryptophan-rich sensory protein [Streptomyces sp. NPDC003703]|uniref:tryptophan-rich sensory protein n=1 Tax=Streptomyces sp. NPDC003283 TaxID=3364681 RepID=UPI0036BB3398